MPDVFAAPAELALARGDDHTARVIIREALAAMPPSRELLHTPVPFATHGIVRSGVRSVGQVM